VFSWSSRGIDLANLPFVFLAIAPESFYTKILASIAASEFNDNATAALYRSRSTYSRETIKSFMEKFLSKGEDRQNRLIKLSIPDLAIMYIGVIPVCNAKVYCHGFACLL